MKVLIITNSYPDYAGSYRGIFIRKLGRALISQGLEVVVLTPRVFRKSPWTETDRGLRVYRFWYPSGGRPLGQAGGIPVLPMVFYMISGLLTALWVVIKERPTIIHGNWIVPTGLIAALVGQLLRIPVINTARGMDVRISEKGCVAKLFDLAVSLSDRLVVVSAAMRIRPGLEHAEVIPSGVDDVFFTLAPERKAPVIISTRSLEPVYDVETLLCSLPELINAFPDLKCVIAGTGSQEIALKGLARRLGINAQVVFLGAVSLAEIVRQMQQASVFVSCCRDDGTSIALLEAMATGLVPVVTDIPANRDWIVHGQEGYLFQPGKANELARCLSQALNASIPRAILERKRIDLKEQITWAPLAAQYRALYREMQCPSDPTD